MNSEKDFSNECAESLVTNESFHKESIFGNATDNFSDPDETSAMIEKVEQVLFDTDNIIDEDFVKSFTDDETNLLFESGSDNTSSKKDSFECDVCSKVFTSTSNLAKHKIRHSGIKPYACPWCPKTFSSTSELNAHGFTHSTTEKRFSCTDCDYKTNRLGNLKTHRLCHTGERPYACTKCSKTFVQVAHLNGHMQSHVGVRSYFCDLCPATFVQSSHLRSHKITHSGVRPYGCDQCPATFARFFNLKVHMTKHLVKKFACDQCPFTCERANHLTYHKTSHTSLRPFLCNICYGAFATKGSFRKHKKYRCKPPQTVKLEEFNDNYSNKNENTDEECFSKMDDTNDMTGNSSNEGINKEDEDNHSNFDDINHESELVDNNESTDSVCPKGKSTAKRKKPDPKEFTTDDETNNLNPIIDKQSTSEKEVYVEVEPINIKDYNISATSSKKSKTKKRFTPIILMPQSNFDNSESTPISGNVYSCDQCDFVSKKWSDMKQHKLVHSEQKSYTCDKCSDTFTQISNLKKHQMTHHQQGPFSCSVCNKSFPEMSQVKEHMAEHSDTKPFSCDECSATFVQLRHLEAHKLNHTIKNFKCDVCSATFSRASYLQKHKLIHPTDKVLTCNQCSYTCDRPNVLRIHKMRHTIGPQPFACNICTLAFTTPSNLKRHQRQKHSEQK